MDGFWEASLKPWDTRAAALILEEAGGRVTGMDGTEWDAYRGDILGTNGPIHDSVGIIRLEGSRSEGLTIQGFKAQDLAPRLVQRHVSPFTHTIEAVEEEPRLLLPLIQHVATLGDLLDQDPPGQRRRASRQRGVPQRAVAFVQEVRDLEPVERTAPACSARASPCSP